MSQSGSRLRSADARVRESGAEVPSDGLEEDGSCWVPCLAATGTGQYRSGPVRTSQDQSRVCSGLSSLARGREAALARLCVCCSSV